MQSSTSSTHSGKRWTARVLSGIGILFLLFDSTIHLLTPQPVIDSFHQLGYPLASSTALGTIELVCVILYLIPRTSVIGVILLTGYLGGAIATQVRIGAPLFSTTLFPVYLGAILWSGLLLRDARLRALLLIPKQV